MQIPSNVVYDFKLQVTMRCKKQVLSSLRHFLIQGKDGRDGRDGRDGVKVGLKLLLFKKH